MKNNIKEYDGKYWREYAKQLTASNKKETENERRIRELEYMMPDEAYSI